MLFYLSRGETKDFTFRDVTKNLNVTFPGYVSPGQGWISDMGIDGPTFVPKGGYFLPILVKVCPQKLAFP